ncbi:unnamed protein product [Eruca vesicaria subsp. sativa]|uniref:Uncharacterized protein n=1 Tax=Eruca vesicaria subsp. sativa TaxID=29727 RepID=A0ABC8LHL0_ERUVS|nr:unnamed protein product [Eruca vesicaria subsp. sativa]
MVLYGSYPGGDDNNLGDDMHGAGAVSSKPSNEVSKVAPGTFAGWVLVEIQKEQHPQKLSCL